MADITLRVNGSEKKVSVSPETPLLWVLRDELNQKLLRTTAEEVLGKVMGK